MKKLLLALMLLPMLVGWPSANMGIGGTTSGSGGGSEPDIAGRPPLLDMYTDYNTRVPAVGGEIAETFADAQDSLAELEALWGTATTVAANDCANNSTVDTALQTALDNAVDEEVIYLNGAAPCYYNVTSTLTLQDRSNVIIVGRGRGNTFIMSDIVTAGSPAVGAHAFVFGASGTTGFKTDTFTWASGFDMGTTSLGITDATGGTEITAGDRIWLQATDSVGTEVPWTSIVNSVSGTAPNKTVVINEPLPADFGGTAATAKIYNTKNTSTGWVDNVGLMDLTIDQTQSARVSNASVDCEPPGSQPTASCPWWGKVLAKFNYVRHARLERVNMPHTFNKFVDLDNGATGNTDHAIFRGNFFDELYMAHSRSNNNSAIGIGSPHVVGHYLVNNVLGDRSPRFYTLEGGSVDAVTGHVVAWTYQPPMEVISTPDTACDTGGGRSMFIGHGGQGITGTLTEGNDFECHMETETNTATAIGLRNVLYRNRLVRTTGGSRAGILTGTASYSAHLTLVLNRVYMFAQAWGGATFGHQGADLWMAYNSAEAQCNLGRNGASGGCAGDASNYTDDTYTSNALSTSAQTVTSSAAYPPSLILENPPSWWCQEACSWLDTAGPGAQEAGGGTYCKLPAQLIAEGATCTPCASNPSACVD